MTRLAAFHDGRPRIQTRNRFAVRVWVHLVLFDTNLQNKKNNSKKNSKNKTKKKNWQNVNKINNN